MIFARGLIISVSSVFVFLLTEPQVIAGGSGCSGFTQTIDLSYTQNGSIYSPGYPNNYDSDKNCRWLLMAPYGGKVLIYFTIFDLEDGFQCNYDSVEIFDGYDNSAPRLSKSCGNSLPLPVHSSGRYMYMEFKSDSSGTGQGFVAHYGALNSSSGSGCSGFTQTIDLSYTPNGSIYSPGYPYNYGNDENCQWILTAPFGGKVLIYFTTFDLEEGYECNYDSVEILDGRYSSSSRLSKSCGSSLPLPVYSSGRYIYMRFKSDSSRTDQGFVAHYRTLTSSSGCAPIVPGASAGVIYSPNFPWNYPNGISCDWNITVPRWKKINLNFTKFNLEYSYGCRDYVEVQNKYGYQMGKYCGSQTPSSVTLYGSIHVQFHSSYWDSYSGFMAFYQTGYSLPTPNPTYPGTTRIPVPYTPSIYACNTHSQTNISVASSSSSSIASSPDIDGYYPTSLPYSTCTFKIDTAKGYILELSFTKMTISSCSGCSCGYVKVRDGTSSSARLLGTYCSSNYHDVVTSKGNHMFVEYYARRRQDNFKATVRSKAQEVNVRAIVVPIVVAVVLFSIIFVVIKSTKIRRSSTVREVPLQPLPLRVEQPPTTQSRYSNTEFGTSYVRQPRAPEMSQPSAPNTELVAPPYPEPLATASDPLPSSTDYSQGNTNMSLANKTA